MNHFGLFRLTALVVCMCLISLAQSEPQQQGNGQQYSQQHGNGQQYSQQQGNGQQYSQQQGNGKQYSQQQGNGQQYSQQQGNGQQYSQQQGNGQQYSQQQQGNNGQQYSQQQQGNNGQQYSQQQGNGQQYSQQQQENSGQQYSQQRQDSLSPAPSYGPPGHTPGEPVGEASCRNTDLKRNEQFVMNFYQDVLGYKRADLVDMYLAPEYINHNPLSSGNGRDDFYQLLKGPLQKIPNQKIDFRRVNAVDDVVWTHTRGQFGGSTNAAVDIFRINCDGQIIEHWDVIQDISSVPTKNPHAYF